MLLYGRVQRLIPNRFGGRAFLPPLLVKSGFCEIIILYKKLSIGETIWQITISNVLQRT